MHGTLAIRSGELDDPAILLGAGILRRGGLVAFPTETVYGLGANALDPLAVGGIFWAKGRPSGDPLIVHIPHQGLIPTLTSSFPPEAKALADAFWPGPLTLILPKADIVPDVVTAGLKSVAIRIPAHPTARALLRAAGVPVAAPSANRFSRPSPTRAAHVAKDLGEVVDLIIDDGDCPVGIESTIVAFPPEGPRILRPGGISKEDIEAVLGRVEYRAFEAQAPGTASISPGTLLRHYAPNAPLHLVDGEQGPALEAIAGLAMETGAKGERVGLLLFEGDRVLGAEAEGWPSVRLRRGDLGAQDLYRALRALDSLGVDRIYGRLPGAEGLGLGLRDRLYRAAEGRVALVGNSKNA